MLEYCSDDYQRCAVRAWEIAALAEQQETRRPRRALQDVAALFKDHAVFLALHAAARLALDDFVPLAISLRNIASLDQHWRCRRALVDAVAVIAQVSPDTATEFVAGIGDEKTKAKWVKVAAAGGRSPRPFFW